ncbi:MAG TPA: adenine deaminase [Phycisphaerae bacterium]|nr:adenine deaminase [Phycisphaerae bacterium]
MPDNNQLRDLIDVAAGRRQADIALKNARVVNVVSHEINEGDIAIVGERIAGIGSYRAAKTVDLRGRYVCPGFIDAHVHVESSLLSVPEFARVVASHGTTAVIADPHEFANVMGTEGISFVLRTAKYAPIDIFVMLSSCVPASPFESAAVELTAEDLQPFLANRWVLGLAEMMNYPGVIAGQEEVLNKMALADRRIADGHAPGLSGSGLTAYAAAGVMSDHECTGPEEAAEKLRCGLHIMIREGSQTRNLKALLPLVTPATADRFMFCTDDKDVRDLLNEGQIDFMIRTAIAGGMDPILAVRLGSVSAARYFGLRQAGAILPGYRADLAVVEDLSQCRVVQTYHRGQLVAEDGRCIAPRSAQEDRVQLRSSIDVHWLEPKDFQIPLPDGRGQASPPKIHVIEAFENRIDTERSIDTASVRDGLVVADSARDLAKIVVIERHRATGEIGRAFVRGFGLKSGAIASSVAHDAHNIIVVGMSDEDMLAATIHLIKLHGGLAVVNGGQVLASVALPIAGLVSGEPAEQVATQLEELSAVARTLGCKFEQPFMALAFLSLSVIGKLKITNQGLIDVEAFRRITLFAD